jgi:hypothetical protein
MYLPDLRDEWNQTEVAKCSDAALAKFYTMLSDSDRWWLKTKVHIDIHGDRRSAHRFPAPWIPLQELL